MDWRDLTTEGRIDAIKAVWQDGMSAAQIVAALPHYGASRNAVIGVLHRHKSKLAGIHLRAFGDNGQVKERKPRKSRVKPASELRHHPRPKAERRIAVVSPSILFDHAPAIPIPEPTPLAIEAPEPLNLTLLELTGHTCKWPVNDPPKGENGHLFCGHETVDGKPWCSHHARLAYGKGTEGERSAPRVLLAA